MQNKLKRNKASGLSTTARRLLELQAFAVSVRPDFLLVDLRGKNFRPMVRGTKKKRTKKALKMTS